MKNDTLKVSLIQTALHWEHPTKNRLMFEHHFKKVPDSCDLLVLPEMFTSGFTMNPEVVAETMTGTTVGWLKSHAKKLNCAICGSLVIAEGDLFYNRFLFVKPDGSMDQYDKRHTFNMAGEGLKYQAGLSPIVITYRGWKIFPQICYDLRFSVFSRNTADYDLVIYVANWPKARIGAWDTLLKARAIENMSYAIGVNRVGIDGNDLEYIGHSAIYDPLGEHVEEQKDISHLEQGEMIITSKLLHKHLTTLRNKLPFLEDRDPFTLG